MRNEKDSGTLFNDSSIGNSTVTRY